MAKNLSKPSREQIRDLILQTVNKEKPETAKQLISLIEHYNYLHKKEIIELLVELENEKKIHFIKKGPPSLITVNHYVFSSKAVWYWTTLVLAVMNTIAVFIIPENAVPLLFLRFALGIIFVLFLPGFALIKALFPARASVKTSSEKLDTIERMALSFGMSLALVAFVGLILNYTPWGIQLTPLTFSLLAITLAFATVAVLREYQTKAQAVKITTIS